METSNDSKSESLGTDEASPLNAEDALESSLITNEATGLVEEADSRPTSAKDGADNSGTDEDQCSRPTSANSPAMRPIFGSRPTPLIFLWGKRKVQC